MVINSDQNQFACQPDTIISNPSECILINMCIFHYDMIVSAFNGCPFEIDDVWDITWPNTERNNNSTQLCPGGHDATGMLITSCII